MNKLFGIGLFLLGGLIACGGTAFSVLIIVGGQGLGTTSSLESFMTFLFLIQTVSLLLGSIPAYFGGRLIDDRDSRKALYVFWSIGILVLATGRFGLHLIAGLFGVWLGMLFVFNLILAGLFFKLES